MSDEEKRVYMLLKSVIFHYHGLDDEEVQNLNETADELDAHDALDWANKFIAEDYITSFERAREYLNNYISDYSRDKRESYIKMVWEANNLKGYITELEVTAMLKLAQDWHVQDYLKELITTSIHSG